MNPRRWLTYSYSSLRFAFSDQCPPWLSPGNVLSEFKGREAYLSFLRDYQQNKDIQEEMKYQLADN